MAAPPYLASRTTPQHRGKNSVTIYSNMRQIHDALYIVYRRRLSAFYIKLNRMLK